MPLPSSIHLVSTAVIQQLSRSFFKRIILYITFSFPPLSRSPSPLPSPPPLSLSLSLSLSRQKKSRALSWLFPLLMIDELSLCGSFWQPLSRSLMTQPEILKHHVILTETARYLCLWRHESALYRGIGQFKSYKSIFFAKLKLLTYHLYATQFPRPPQPFRSERL